ncbi:hypothetical protein QTP81_12600 [Alteromonas sp. ASW11-36]|uniref:DUF1648 domain-containing protein n=1 Tax=Alteromonas arenosi TaxID=3055817 RepID=A0ABT7SZ15_9ALTE|nr:hypothetical protein [Alteromonas sp. ASW11-36]MDM7861433.1 hypothetical protein [Alteromonas sp. ASW11-36]
MKKLLITILVVWTVFYVMDYVPITPMNIHLDLNGIHHDVVEWFLGGVVLTLVVLALAAVLATGILAVFVVTAVVVATAFVAIGLSALWPITIAVLLYLVCRDRSQANC